MQHPRGRGRLHEFGFEASHVQPRVTHCASVMPGTSGAQLSHQSHGPLALPHICQQAVGQSPLGHVSSAHADPLRMYPRSPVTWSQQYKSFQPSPSQSWIRS